MADQFFFFFKIPGLVLTHQGGYHYEIGKWYKNIFLECYNWHDVLNIYLEIAQKKKIDDRDFIYIITVLIFYYEVCRDPIS